MFILLLFSCVLNYSLITGTLAKQAIVKLQKIVQVSGSGTGLGIRRGEDVYGSDVSLPEEPPPSKRPCTMPVRTKLSIYSMYEICK